MKSCLLLVSLLTMTSAFGQSPAPDAAAAKSNLASGVYAFDQLPETKKPQGSSRAVFDGPTSTVARLHCHISTLNPGKQSSEPHRHEQEEVIIVTSGTLEANWDGHTQTATAGSVIFFAAGATTFLRNASTAPVTYAVINYFPTLPAKQ